MTAHREVIRGKLCNYRSFAIELIHGLTFYDLLFIAYLRVGNTCNWAYFMRKRWMYARIRV